MCYMVSLGAHVTQLPPSCPLPHSLFPLPFTLCHVLLCSIPAWFNMYVHATLTFAIVLVTWRSLALFCMVWDVVCRH